MEFQLIYTNFFKNKLSPHLLDMYEESFDKGFLPVALNTAAITALLKPGQPPNLRGSYRPISPLNAKNALSAKRLESVLPKMVHPDQNGFVQARQGFHNMGRVVNILFEKSGKPLYPCYGPTYLKFYRNSV